MEALPSTSKAERRSLYALKTSQPAGSCGEPRRFSLGAPPEAGGVAGV